MERRSFSCFVQVAKRTVIRLVLCSFPRPVARWCVEGGGGGGGGCVQSMLQVDSTSGVVWIIHVCMIGHTLPDAGFA